MKIVTMLLLGLVVFGASAGGAWYVKTKVLPQNDPAETAEAIAAKPTIPDLNGVDTSDILPTAVRDEPMSVEEILRFGLGLKEREKTLMTQEEEFQKRMVRQDIVLADMRAEQQTITGLSEQLSHEYKSAGELVDKLNLIRNQILDERKTAEVAMKSIESKQIEFDEQFQSNDKKLSTWLQGMESSKAAEVLKQMANDGKMDVAVQLLSNFEEREAAKILDSIDDTKLLNEFISEFRNLKNKKANK